MLLKIYLMCAAKNITIKILVFSELLGAKGNWNKIIIDRIFELEVCRATLISSGTGWVDRSGTTLAQEVNLKWPSLGVRSRIRGSRSITRLLWITILRCYIVYIRNDVLSGRQNHFSTIHKKYGENKSVFNFEWTVGTLLRLTHVKFL